MRWTPNGPRSCRSVIGTSFYPVMINGRPRSVSPVIVKAGGCRYLAIASARSGDRMITRYARSVDGLDWHDQGVVLRVPRKLGRPRRADYRNLERIAVDCTVRRMRERCEKLA
jgi:hypothetical protein